MNTSERVRPSDGSPAEPAAAADQAARGVRSLWKENGLSIALFGFFLLFLAGQSYAGMLEYNQELEEHGRRAVGYVQYLGTGHFVEAVFENWESEFLQMAAFVVFTVFLYQKGSAESKKPDEEEPVDADPREKQDDPNAPWPVRRGGFVLKLYENSLCLALLALFAISFILHAAGGARVYSEEQVLHGEEPVSLLEYLGTSRFWFESLQNWQSEFLAVFAIVVLSVFLRQRGSPESKPVAAPHSQTGAE